MPSNARPTNVASPPSPAVALRVRSAALARTQGPVARAPVASVDSGDVDASLVARCRADDGEAWAELVQRYQRLVYAIVARMGIDEHGAADVFQSVFSRLFEHLPRIADPRRLQAWIVTTAKREGLHQRRLSQRNVSMTHQDESLHEGAEWDLADEAPIAEDALADLQQLNLLRNGLEQLDERCRTLLTLLFRDEDDALSYDDVARRLGTSVGSIGPTRSRCLDKLRRLVT